LKNMGNKRRKAKKRKAKAKKNKGPKIPKILLLGSGESGKSTIFKQLKVIYGNGFTESELKGFIPEMKENMMEGMLSILKASERFDVTYDKSQGDFIQTLLDYYEDDDVVDINKIFTTDFANKLKKLWNTDQTKKILENRNQLQLFDSVDYLFAKIDEIKELDFMPSIQDVLTTRVKTTGISRLNFKIENKPFEMIDVGGQRNERKKWSSCFTGVSIVLYVVSLAEYDLKCYEDDETLRIEESLRLFKGIVNNMKFFSQTPIVLIFNKTDIFAEKIKKIDLSVTCPKYTGGKDFDKSIAFLKEIYLSQRNIEKEVPIYFTCATDEKDMREKFKDILCSEGDTVNQN